MRLKKQSNKTHNYLQQTNTWKKFLKENSYLLFAALLLFSLSIFTSQADTNGTKRFTKSISAYIQKAEQAFKIFVQDKEQLSKLENGSADDKLAEKLAAEKNYYHIYGIRDSALTLLYWNTQAVLPDSAILYSSDSIGFAALPNGYYLWQKKQDNALTIVSLTAIKWNYIISNDHLQNNFVTDKKAALRYEINGSKGVNLISSAGGKPLFFINDKTGDVVKETNQLTVWLRIVAIIPLLFFIHFCTLFIYTKKRLFAAVSFLFFVLFSLRLLSYFFPLPVNLRQFELFDPSIYGSDIVLRSLGDLVINILLFFWVISFVRLHLKGRQVSVPARLKKYKWPVVACCSLIIVLVSFISATVIRSLVADSQISFDVLDFFSLNIYSVTGFLVLCCIAIGYYYFCRVMLFYVSNFLENFLLPVSCFVIAISLLLLSFRIGKIEGNFELFALAWLLFFLLLMKSDLKGFFASGIIVSKMVFWLFFFSVTVAAIIISENSRKEIRNRQHYAEIISTKTDPITEVLINTMLTDFRADLLSQQFHLLHRQASNIRFKDSIINNNLSGYTDKYDTRILTYDSLENTLYNETATSYNTINSIFNTQAKPTTVEGLFFYDAGFDKFNYIAKKTVKNAKGSNAGYIFIIVSPKNVSSQIHYPELFSRGTGNSIDNSAAYAYAVYDKGKLINSHNDYAFSTRYPETYFAGKPFLSLIKKNYNELWYNPGGDKFVVVVKENRLLIESITLFSYLFCAFLILSALSWLISFMVKSGFRFKKMISVFQLSIKQQVHGTVIFISLMSFMIIGVATILFFINRYETNNKETLSRTISIMEQQLQRVLSKEKMQNAVFAGLAGGPASELETDIKNISSLHGLDINLYDINGVLKASSLPLPYVKGILSTQIDPVAYYHVHTAREIQYFQQEEIGTLGFVSSYIPVTDIRGNDIAYLNIPYFTSQTKLQQEISNFLVTIINLNAFIFLIAGIVSLIITNKITSSFSLISEKMKQINVGKVNEIIVWNRDDEIGALVNEYNHMLIKLDESAAALARKERESAWQEMAKQVAHEIKNPLTPMKLSMQFLKKSIDNNEPNIKELATRVSATLVEQIDHLSTIAGEFSRFANIENAKPEMFNINDALISLRQLYEGDSTAYFEWHILDKAVMVFADKTHVNRILTNLIVNGIQAVEENEKAYIAVSETLEDNLVTIRIADNGTGIDEAIRQKIFTPNFTTKSSGTGLGLAMCKRMAEQAGGDIRYETSAAGTAFFVVLPVAD